jgi:hypothetical protein
VILDENGSLIDAAMPDVTMTHTETNFKEHPDPAYSDGTIANTLTFRVDKEDGDWAELRLDAHELMSSVDMSSRVQSIDPWYTSFRAACQLSFDIDGVQYNGTGVSTLERMDLE